MAALLLMLVMGMAPLAGAASDDVDTVTTAPWRQRALIEMRIQIPTRALLRSAIEFWLWAFISCDCDTDLWGYMEDPTNFDSLGCGLQHVKNARSQIIKAAGTVCQFFERLNCLYYDCPLFELEDLRWAYVMIDLFWEIFV